MIVVASPALFDRPPSLDDPRVKQTLVKTQYRTEVSAKNLSWVPPAEFKVLGQVEPTAEDIAITCNIWSFWEGLAKDVLRQWRWDNDREALLEDQRRAKEQYEREASATSACHWQRFGKSDSSPLGQTWTCRRRYCASAAPSSAPRSTP
jgi:hypothetical protein